MNTASTCKISQKTHEAGTKPTGSKQEPMRVVISITAVSVTQIAVIVRASRDGSGQIEGSLANPIDQVSSRHDFRSRFPISK